MKAAVRSRVPHQAQTLVIFAIAIGVICLLCGFAIDSGLLYLAKARLSRAVDGAALSAVGNFNTVASSSDPTGALNRDAVATIMRNFAIANYSDLKTIGTSGSITSGGVQSTYTTSTGATYYQYTYTFYDSSPVTGGADPNANPPYRRYVQVILQAGSGNQITSGQCNARCPAHTYFMGIVPAFSDLKVSSSAVAVRNPRLIMVVVDRSGSMLSSGGGAFGLPAAITTFLNFFDTSSDYIGLVSFGSNARLEMPLTTNFLEAGTNDLYDSYQIDNDGSAIPGVDPEEYVNYNNFLTNGVRRMKFGGQTAADEGIRMGLEQLMQNPGYNNPNVVKYMVIFTDGAWNTVRTLVAAPGYTNVFTYPSGSGSGYPYIQNYASYQGYAGVTNNTPGVPFGTIPMPFMSPWPDYSNSVTYTSGYKNGNGFDYGNHLHDVWQSADGLYEPLSGGLRQIIGAPTNVASNFNNLKGLDTGYIYSIYVQGAGNVDAFTTTANVWLPPGSVDYYYAGNSTPSAVIVSDYTHPAQTTNVDISGGGNYSNVLVVPGYIADGILTDSLDLPFPDDPFFNGNSAYTSYRADGFNQPFMWPDEAANNEANALETYTFVQNGVMSQSLERALLFRNYVNLLTGYYVMRPDDPMSASIEPLTGANRPLNPNGHYYPGAAFYFPFDDIGVDSQPTFALRNAISDPDPTDTGLSRFISYSINMLSTNAAPEYAGELFYVGTQGTGVLSGTTAVSTQITSSSTWQNGAPAFVQNYINNGTTAGIMTNEASHYPTNIGGALWRPTTFNGSNSVIGNQNYVTTTNAGNFTSLVNPNDSANITGGYVTDGTGRVFRNAMAYSGRPTHYFDFSTGQWKPIPDNHDINNIALALGNWKAQEYAWHARAAGVTIYTVGYGSDVNNSEQILLAQVANATNSTGATTGLLYNPSQPIGQQFYAATPDAISNDFYQIGTAINGALTQ